MSGPRKFFCPKCGRDVALCPGLILYCEGWRQGPRCTQGTIAHDEHLSVVCQCGYSWNAPCSDETADAQRRRTGR